MTNLGDTYFAIVPTGTRDEYAAGYDGNVFDSADHAEAAIDDLCGSGQGFDTAWEVAEFPTTPADRRRWARLNDASFEQAMMQAEEAGREAVRVAADATALDVTPQALADWWCGECAGGDWSNILSTLTEDQARAAWERGVLAEYHARTTRNDKP